MAAPADVTWGAADRDIFRLGMRWVMDPSTVDFKTNTVVLHSYTYIWTKYNTVDQYNTMTITSDQQPSMNWSGAVNVNTPSGSAWSTDNQQQVLYQPVTVQLSPSGSIGVGLTATLTGIEYQSYTYTASVYKEIWAPVRPKTPTPVMEASIFENDVTLTAYCAGATSFHFYRDGFWMSNPLIGAGGAGAYGATITFEETISGTHAYTARAYYGGTDNLSDACAPLSLTYTAPPPDPATAVTNTRNSDTSHAVAWTLPSTSTWKPRTKVRVDRWDKDSNAWSTLTDTLAAGATSYTDTTTTIDNQYKYRVYCGNTVGWSAAAASGTTTTTPKAPTSVTATRSGANIVVQWAHTSNVLTAIKLEKWDKVSNAWSIVSSSLPSTDLQYTHVAPAVDNEYKYRVSFSNAVGTGATTTSNSAFTTPAAPSSATSARSGSNIVASWTNNSRVDTLIRVERWDLASGTWSTLTSALAATATSYTDSTVSTDNRYQYRISCAATVAEWSATATTNTTNTVPKAPTSVSAARSGANIVLSITNDSRVESFIKVERWSAASGTWTVLTSSLAANSTSYTDTAPAIDNKFQYRISNGNDAGTSATVSSGYAYTTPKAPSGVTSAASGADIVISWTNNSTIDTAIRVERWDLASGVWVVMTSTLATTTTSYTHTAPSLDNKHQYRVSCVQGSEWSATASSNYTYTTPAAPTNVSAARSGADLALAWTNTSRIASGFEVWHKATEHDAAWVSLGTVTAATSSFTFPNYDSTDTHIFAVSSYYSTLASDKTSSNTLHRLPVTPSGVTAVRGETSNALSWTDNNPHDAATYEITVSENGGAYTALASVSGALAAYEHTGTNLNKTYQYGVYCAYQGATSGTSYSSVLPPVGLAYPTGFVAERNASGASIDLSWGVHPDANAAFEIYRSTDEGASYQYLNTTAVGATSFADTSPNLSTTNKYAIRAYTSGDGRRSSWVYSESVLMQRTTDVIWFGAEF